MTHACTSPRLPPLLEPLEARVLLSAVPLGERIDVAWTDRATGWAEPSVAMHADGRFLVTWKESSGVPIPYPGTSIMGRLFRSDGSPQDEALVLVRPLHGDWRNMHRNVREKYTTTPAKGNITGHESDFLAFRHQRALAERYAQTDHPPQAGAFLRRASPG